VACPDSSDQCAGLLWLEVCGGAASGALDWNCQNAVVLLGTRDVVAQEVFGETAYRGKSTIAGHNAVATLGFDVVEKRKYGLGVYVLKSKIGDGMAGAFGQKEKEELERVTIGTDGMLTCTDDPAQVFFEEALY